MTIFLLDLLMLSTILLAFCICLVGMYQVLHIFGITPTIIKLMHKLGGHRG